MAHDIGDPDRVPSMPYKSIRLTRHRCAALRLISLKKAIKKKKTGAIETIRTTHYTAPNIIIKLYTRKYVILQIITIETINDLILDSHQSKQSDECIDSTMMIVFLCLYTEKLVEIMLQFQTSGMVYDGKLNFQNILKAINFEIPYELFLMQLKNKKSKYIYQSPNVSNPTAADPGHEYHGPPGGRRPQVKNRYYTVLLYLVSTKNIGQMLVIYGTDHLLIYFTSDLFIRYRSSKLTHAIVSFEPTVLWEIPSHIRKRHE
ncbi:hypothetical protein AGLY_006429 [Aphis glycines]|uniref:Uncharacterized protein n=1 Tax=Aphis glycines TaxID=307491 RepID=A0A6G0TRI5_APHGL|nr:hypothetical protein AGLY_006429 [Aphis glycines]